MSARKIIELAVWRAVPAEAIRLAKSAAVPAMNIVDALTEFHDVDAATVFNPDTRVIICCHSPDENGEKMAAMSTALKRVPEINEVRIGPGIDPPKNEPYIHIKRALTVPDVLDPVLSAAQLKHNWLNRLWGGPNPLAATIAGGLLGAGLGYGTGWLAEKFLPEEYFERAPTRRTGAVLGGMLGATPGALWSLSRLTNPAIADKSWLQKLTFPKEGRAALRSEFTDEELQPSGLLVKFANGEFGGLFDKKIPTDQFGRAIWNDISGFGGHTSPPVAATMGGVLQAASISSGTNLVSPFDIARIGVGAGSGYVSGLIVGKALGALAGLKPNAQQALQRTGVWAGILTNLAPMILGR